MRLVNAQGKVNLFLQVGLGTGSSALQQARTGCGVSGFRGQGVGGKRVARMAGGQHMARTQGPTPLLLCHRAASNH